LPEVFTTRTADSGNYGKFSKRSNRFLQKEQKSFHTAKNIAPCRRLWLHPAMPVPSPTIAPAARRRLKIFYSGRVQGVGFRYSVKTVAAGFEVSGIVRNLPDGRVELIAEGLHDELKAFRDAILGAGLAGFIRDEQVDWTNAQNEFSGFEISR
jgi:acylphosphatase